MATAYFVDSSALVKRYVRETGTAWVRGITRRRSSTYIYVALITAVEVTSAIARRRGVTLSAAQASSLLSRFRKQLIPRYWPWPGGTTVETRRHDCTRDRLVPWPQTARAVILRVSRSPGFVSGRVSRPPGAERAREHSKR